MKIFRVYDDEWEQIYGIKQLKNFATSQVFNNPDDFIEENLKDYYKNYKSILNLANKIINENYTVKTMKQVDAILNVRCFDYEILYVE